ncbi:DNA-binding transcriptional repressor AcrR [uncultured Eubacterium sp.]|nr:DNA-binding transcriptional repressor AcrR [uncultured Eubacterium sp.]
MIDETREKIINATMNLVMDRGYSLTTTKDIAFKAGINECTIFRKFRGKKDIVLSAMKLPEWKPDLKEEDLAVYTGELESDLIRFSNLYMEKVTPKMVKVSIGLRTPELIGDTAAGIMAVPAIFKNCLTAYFEEMQCLGKIKKADSESLAMTFLSMNFGFIFLQASFDDQLSPLSKEEYINASVRTFIQGIA